MKTIKILLAFITIMSLTKCGSTKFQKNPPFKIISASYNHWIGGIPGVSGTNVKINFTSEKNIVFDSIYFLNRVTKLELKKSEGTTLIMGYFKNQSSNNIKRDYNLNAVAIKEVGNKPPLSENFPFQLKENEAVISYKKGSTIKYFKILNIKKGKSIPYRSFPKQ